MEKFARVKFVGRQEEYISGKYCDEWRYCVQCPQHKECAQERKFLFLEGKEYKAYFLDFLQGTRDVLDVEAENQEVLSFVPLQDFEIVSDEYGILEDKRAIVKCIKCKGAQDLQVGKNYIALKRSKDKTKFYILDDSKDCYYYSSDFFVVVEDKDNLLKD